MGKQKNTCRFCGEKMSGQRDVGRSIRSKCPVCEHYEQLLPVCPYCNGEHVEHVGVEPFGVFDLDHYRCEECGEGWLDSSQPALWNKVSN